MASYSGRLSQGILTFQRSMHRDTIIPQTAPGMPPQVPPPSRHGSPSGPWPFLDMHDEVDHEPLANSDSHLHPSAATCTHVRTATQEFCWCKYPQSLYPNWTEHQQKKSKIAEVIKQDKDGQDNSAEKSTLHYLDVMDDGKFVNAGKWDVTESRLDKVWAAMQEKRPANIRVRTIFVEGLSGPVLQMLGHQYNIEPFFFSSAIGWIPSGFQSHVVPGKSDHITINLSFIRPMKNSTTAPLVIDTQAPLPLRPSNWLLQSDRLAVHMVRSRSSTIISLHPNARLSHHASTAKVMQTRVYLTGRSVYWGNIFDESEDSTFVLLSLLWYAQYAWDEALQLLYNHIYSLESHILVTNDVQMTRELHVVRAHLLHYGNLLEDFKNTVVFVRETPNPRMEVRQGKKQPARQSESEADPTSLPLEEESRTREEDEEGFEKLRIERSAARMKLECHNLLLAIERLERTRKVQEQRVKNLMDLKFSLVNIEDSKISQKLAEAAVKDSAAMKQIAYLSMVFLPASFVASIFGMNVSQFTGTPNAPTNLAHYFAAAFPLTVITIWIVVAYQIQITEPRMRTPETLDDNGGGNGGAENEVDVQQYNYLGTSFGKIEGSSGGEMVKKLKLWQRVFWPAILFSSMFDRWRRIERVRRRRSKALTRADKMV